MTTLRPFDSWTANYVRKCFESGLMDLEDVQAFASEFRDGMTVAKILAAESKPCPECGSTSHASCTPLPELDADFIYRDGVQA